MDQVQMAREMLARRSGLQLLRGLNDLARKLPHPDGKTLRVTVEVIDSGEQLGSVDMDTTNASDLGSLASRRDTTVRSAKAATPAAPAPLIPIRNKTNLRLVGEGA
ncbi:hypothetical protein ABZ383_30445 [Streptomyces sp. NPDC005900]|uniref:hypothetical protein n=1 Tax=Streptomyces sp. NPDC005900 TaxID=3154569 RepID=UPI00340AFB43